jgi:hypothetical protein
MPESVPPEIFSYSPSLGDLTVDRESVERGLGYRNGPTSGAVREVIDEILPEMPSRVTIQCGYRILPDRSISVANGSLSTDSIQFSVGPILARELKKSTSLALFVTTVGPRMEQWSRQLMESGDMMKGSLVDAVASEVVEQTSEWLENRIARHVESRGWSITNRYSPGYCDWSVAEQHKLFSLLPSGFCGISLTPSALMVPIKSLSGIIGLGREVERGAYQCSICDLQDCYRRRDESELPAERR